MNHHEEQRARHRRVARECGALIDLLNELYPLSALPPLSASEREIGAWLGERRLIERLNTLRADKASDGVPAVLGA